MIRTVSSVGAGSVERCEDEKARSIFSSSKRKRRSRYPGTPARLVGEIKLHT